MEKEQEIISIVIATKGRIDCLCRLLESLCHVNGRNEIDHEIIIANNATEEFLARRVDDVVKRFSQCEAGPFRLFRENRPGKASAINNAIPLTKGNILAFLDDDVAVAPDWLEAVAAFFRNHPFGAMQGTIIFPPEMEKDPKVQRIYQRYRTVSLYPARPQVKQVKSLTGANIAIRKELFTSVGLFDTRLGPGRSGTSDDTELADRIIRAGGRIGCEPKAVVYHDVDWSRLTEEYFRLRHEQQGRSRLIYKQTFVLSIVVDLMRSIAGLLWHSVLNNERKKYRAKGRYYHYRAMLRQKTTLGFNRRSQGSLSTVDPLPYSQKELPVLERKNP